MTDYLVIYERASDGGWGAYLPDLPGVVALGDTKAQAAERISEALRAYAADLRDRGESMPGPVSSADRVSV